MDRPKLAPAPRSARFAGTCKCGTKIKVNDPICYSRDFGTLCIPKCYVERFGNDARIQIGLPVASQVAEVATPASIDPIDQPILPDPVTGRFEMNPKKRAAALAPAPSVAPVRRKRTYAELFGDDD
jgi:hypothetical protein